MEIMRQAIRGLLGTDSKPYRVGATCIDCLLATRKEGFGTWRALQGIATGKGSDAPSPPIALKGLKYPIHARPGTHDAQTIISNVIREEYGQFTPTDSPKWLIDAGAYIGDTTAYFLSRFPGLRAIALEPNPPSHALAEKNLRPYGERATLLQKGLYSSEQVSYFSGNETGASIAAAGLAIQCTTVMNLVQRYSIPRIDILKMDIEGAEEAVFLAKPEEWLRHTDLLILEIHGPHIETLVSRVLRENDFSMKQYRSVWYCRPGRTMKNKQ